MRMALPILLMLSLLTALTGCPKPLSVTPSGSPTTITAPKDPITPLSEHYALKGTVNIPGYKAQATLAEVASASAVSLIQVTSGQTISSTVTQSDGSFTLRFSSFAPVINELYLLEAIKGLKAGANPNRAGASVARVRTLIRWTSTGWEGMTNNTITISPSTTALCVIAGLRQFSGGAPVNQAELIKSITLGTPDAFAPKASGIDPAEYNSVYGLVNTALNLDEDPVFVITYNTATLTYSKVTTSVGVAAITPAIARIGQNVVIYGSNFIADVTQDRVFFNNAEATEVSINSIGTQLTVRVPVGATSGPLSIRIGSVVFGGLTFQVQSWDGHTPFDSSGNLYIAGYANNTLFRMAPDGTITRILEGGALNQPIGVAVSGSKVYVSNQAGGGSTAGTVLQVDTANGNAVTTYASGLYQPLGLAFDASGNLYVANGSANNVIKVPPGGGSSSVYASGFNRPAGLAFDLSGNLWVSNHNGNSISRVDATTQAVTTPISGGSLNKPWGLAFNSTGDLMIANYGENQILRYRSGALTPVLANPGIHKGISSLAYDTSGLLYVGAWDSHTFFTLNPQGGLRDLALIPRSSWGIAKDPSNNLYVTVSAQATRRHGYWAKDTRIYRMAYDTTTQTYGPPTPYLDGFSEACSVAFNSAGVMYVGDAASGRVYRIDPVSMLKTVFVEGVGNITQIAFDSANRLYISRRQDSMLRYSAAGVQELNYAHQDRNLKHVAIGSDGNYYTTSYREGVIQKINPTTGEVTRWITGLTNLDGIVFFGGYLFVAEQGGNRIARYDLSGNRFVFCSSGLNSPSGLAFNPSDSTLYVANHGNGTISSIPWNAGSGGAATALPGVSIPTYTGRPWALHLAYSGNTLWTADMRPGERRIIKIDITNPAAPVVTNNFAQIPVGIDSLDGTPWGMAAHSNGNLYVTDGRRWWGRLVQVNMSTGAVTAYSPISTWLGGLTIDGNGDLLATSMQNRGYNGYRVIKFNPSGSVLASYGSQQWRTIGVAIDGSNSVWSLPNSWGDYAWLYFNRMTGDQSWVRGIDTIRPPSGGAGPITLNIDKPTGDKFIGFMHAQRALKVTSAGVKTYFDGVGFCSGLINVPNGDLYGVSNWGAVGTVPIFRIPASIVNTGGTAVVPNNWCYQPAF